MVITRAALVAFAVSIAHAAWAQNAYCVDPNTRRADPSGTAALQQMTQMQDPQLMQRLVGVWYAEIRSEAGNQIDYHYQSFEPGGLFTYRSRVCGGLANLCSQYEGTGLYAVRQQGDGSFFGMSVVSDVHRDHECGAIHGRFVDAATFTDDLGNSWRRVR